MRVAIIVLILIIVIAVFAPQISTYHPLHTDTNNQLSPPNSEHWLGTDYLGRDVFARVLYGTRTTLSIAILGMIITASISGFVGSLGFILSRMTSIFKATLYVWLSIPNMLISLMILTIVGHGFIAIAVAIGLSQVGRTSYFIYTQFKLVESADYVDASLVLGATRWHIIWQHIFVNVRPALLVFFATNFAYAVLNVATLSFLGLGGEPSAPELGRMLSDGRNSFQSAPWVAFYPGLVIFIVNYCIYEIVDKLNQR